MHTTHNKRSSKIKESNINLITKYIASLQAGRIYAFQAITQHNMHNPLLHDQEYSVNDQQHTGYALDIPHSKFDEGKLSRVVI